MLGTLKTNAMYDVYMQLMNSAIIFQMSNHEAALSRLGGGAPSLNDRLEIELAWQTLATRVKPVGDA